MSDGLDDGPAPEGRTQTGRAIALVVVVAVIAILVLKHSSAPAPTRSAAATTTTTTLVPGGKKPTVTTTTLPAARPPSEVTIQVLNGLQTGTLAGDLTTKLKTEHGYATLVANDTTSPTTTSGIYVAKTGYYPEAVVLANYLGLPRADIHRVIPLSAPFPAGVVTEADLVVVIGTSLQAKV